MPRVLTLSFHFPPIGGASGQRPARVVRHLLEHGYEATVVTAPRAGTGRWTPVDEGLAREVPGEVEILRVPGPEPAEATGWRRRGERWLRVDEAWSKWWVEGAERVAREVECDLVYAWMAPFESARVASRVARRLGVPWVADLGDPWALDEMTVYPSALHRRLEARAMRRALASADAVVMSTPQAAANVRAAFPALHAVVAIGNGYDAHDFAGEPPARDDDAFRIVHTGYLHTELGLRHREGLSRRLGGAVRGLDILTRSHVYLCEAVAALGDRRVEVHLAGVATDADRAVADRYAFVRLLGYRSHTESVELLRSADLLFLPMHDLPEGTRASIVPGKTYEYLAARRPILAAVPDGDAKDILAEAGGAHIVRPSDVDGMRRAIERELAHPSSGTRRSGVVERYEYGRLTAQLVRVFDGVLGRRDTRRLAA